MPYLNVDEVESALQHTAETNPGVTGLIDLPHRTWGDRSSRAIRVHQGQAASQGVYFLGGVHAREWGSSDILVSFVQRTTDAYRNGTGITLGGKEFTSSDVRRIVKRLDIVVFPQANPDGRQYSMTVDPMWRKNRRPTPSASPVCAVGGGCGPGVDVNRNYPRAARRRAGRQAMPANAGEPG